MPTEASDAGRALPAQVCPRFRRACPAASRVANLCGVLYIPVPHSSVAHRSCKQAVLQFVLVKPVFAVVSLIFLAIDVYDSVWYQVCELCGA